MIDAGEVIENVRIEHCRIPPSIRKDKIYHMPLSSSRSHFLRKAVAIFQSLETFFDFGPNQLHKNQETQEWVNDPDRNSSVRCLTVDWNKMPNQSRKLK